MSFSKKISNLFESLVSKPRLGGFQITDSSLRYLFLEEEKPRTFSVKLPPGVVSGGKVQNEEDFLYYLKQLHGLILPEEPEEKVRAVVCLPSAITYTQNYSIPNVGRDRLEEAAKLNLEMISPVPVEEACMSWQLIGETEDKFELLGAFAEAYVVKRFRLLMEQAGFSPMIFEFPSLSLSWTINNEFGPRPESFLILNISGDGIDLFLLRNGSIYFDYFRSWRSIQGERKEISREDFDQVVIEEIRKVASFTSSRFNETLKYVFVVAPGLEEEMKNLIEANFQVQAAPLRLRAEPLDSSWYAVLGSAIRGNWNRAADNFVSLGTYRVKDLFFRDQVVNFIKLWRGVFAGVMAVFLILMFGSYFLLHTQPKTLEERLNIFGVGFEREEITKLKGSVGEFNSLVSAALEVKGDRERIPAVLESTREMAEGSGVVIDSINVSSDKKSVSAAGRAPSYETVIDFKNVLIGDSRFKNVNIPFSKIFSSEGEFVSFDVSFEYNSR